MVENEKQAGKEYLKTQEKDMKLRYVMLTFRLREIKQSGT